MGKGQPGQASASSTFKGAGPVAQAGGTRAGYRVGAQGRGSPLPLLPPGLLGDCAQVVTALSSPAQLCTVESPADQGVLFTACLPALECQCRARESVYPLGLSMRWSLRKYTLSETRRLVLISSSVHMARPVRTELRARPELPRSGGGLQGCYYHKFHFYGTDRESNTNEFGRSACRMQL